ncbi:hypothetical protein EG329_002825 [Mollisiaceae sp. DMI_Dod_QoI]|nr:hypothetical protein EG329_002825 [Helotiales sp. DMI_Dod_QoI]
MAKVTSDKASTSHKRTSSAAGNTQAPPQGKRQAQDVSKPSEPQYVYVVMVDAWQVGQSTSEIHGVYSTLKDANNAVKSYVNLEFSGVEEYDRGTDEDGLVFWTSDDTGEGDTASVYIKKVELKGPDSERDCEWDDSDYEEYEEQEEEEEDGGDE